MSGTSLDGLDLCLVKFSGSDPNWTFEILKTETVPYSTAWQKDLAMANVLSGEALTALDVKLGHYFGQMSKRFLTEPVDYIASHGHTVFHQPDQGFTLQIGNGAAIHAVTGIPVIYDFRSLDVALGGQGAPLVPIGDQYLFSAYRSCINFGGIANLSFNGPNGERLAYDICPVNMALNQLVEALGLQYDDGGKIAATGKVIPELLEALNGLGYYQLNGPKSLGVEWYKAKFEPIIDNDDFSISDRLRTVNEHIAIQVAKAIANLTTGKVLMTGGGAYNDFLMSRIKSMTHHEVVVPDVKIIEFKEALIFAFLGLLKVKGLSNVLSSVTGASRDSSSGLRIG